MPHKEFRFLLDDENALRVRLVTEKGRVQEFMVQLECRFNDQWHAVVRYDSAHGYAHVDVLHPQGRTVAKRAIPVRDLNEGLAFALRDLKANWLVYRRRYERWLEHRENS